MRSVIRFSSFGGYATFSRPWWNDMLWYTTGLSVYQIRTWACNWGMPGWCDDIYTYWHRARYGWAPRDVWNLDGYLNTVFAGSLAHFANTSVGAPNGYPTVSSTWDTETNFEQWNADLRRWANAFSEDPNDVTIYDVPDYTQHHLEETRRRENIHQALKELEPWWDSLWN